MTTIERRDSGTGLYIHVPFCLSKCDYCAFYSIVPDAAAVSSYLARLAQEAETRLGGGEKRFQTVFVGGGNPTCLGLEGLKSLCATVLQYVDPAAVKEWTFETNPETLTAEIIDYLATLPGIRLSMGIQRLQEKELQLLGRRASLTSVFRALDLSCSRLNNVGADFILGVPGCASIAAELEKLVEQFPLMHVSAYFLTVEEGTPLQVAIDHGKMPAPDDVGPEELFQVRDVLRASGFEHYEISNHARNGARCLHNMNYWLPGNYTGLGPSAVSTSGDCRSSNAADLGLWLSGVDPSLEFLSAVDRRNEYTMLRLRLLSDGLNIATLERRFGCQESEFFYELSRLLEEGYLQKSGDSTVKLTDRGLIMADDVMASLFI